MPAEQTSSPSGTDAGPTPPGRLARLAGRARPVVLLALLAALGWALARQWRPLSEQFARLSLLSLLLATVAALASVAGQMLAWRALLSDLGSPLAPVAAGRVFFLGQLGKYLPGSVWPVLAQMELARDLRVPRERTATTVLLFMLLNVVSAGIVGGIILPFVLSGSSTVARWRWFLLLLVALVLLLVPAVLNRLVALVLRLVRRPTPTRQLSRIGVLRAAAWLLFEWAAAGGMLAALLSGFGGRADPGLAVGAFALAWAAGFVVLVVPAGAGVREAVMVVLLSGRVASSTALAAALGTRLLMTVADAVWALLLLPTVLRGRRATRPEVPDGAVAATTEGSSNRLAAGRTGAPGAD